MKNVATDLERLKEAAKGIAGDRFMNELLQLQEKLAQEKLYLVVVGLFKRGKSSLINRLLETEVVPVAVTPVTAVITLIEYTENDAWAEVHFSDGRSEKKEITEAALYISEEENPGNEKKAELVKIYSPAPLLKHLTLVDTPGLGSSYEHNTETTLRFIPKVDTALFVLSADMPVSKSDIEFLKELKQLTAKILFVLNKADLLNEKDLQKILQHNTQVIAAIMHGQPEAIHILPVSSKINGEESGQQGIRLLKNKIISLAQKDKQQILQQSGIRQFQALKNELSSLLQLKRDSLQMPVKMLEEKQRQFRNSVSLLQEQRDEFQILISGKIKQLDQYIHETVNRIKKETDKEIDEIIQQELQKKTFLKNADAVYAVQQEINQMVLSHFGKTREKMEAETKQHFRNLLQQYCNRSQSFLNELAKNLSALMGLDFDLIAGRFDLDVYTSFYLTLQGGEQPISFNGGIAHLLLPAHKKEKRMAQKMQAHFREVVNRNTASLIYDLQYKVQESFRKFNYDLNQRLKELLSGIEKILEDTLQEKNKTEGEIAAEIEEIKNRIQILQQTEFTDTG
jgi:small GTP-binding protein